MTLNARAYSPKTKASFRPINPAVLAERRRLKCWIRATKHASDQHSRDATCGGCAVRHSRVSGICRCRRERAASTDEPGGDRAERAVSPQTFMRA